MAVETTVGGSRTRVRRVERGDRLRRARAGAAHAASRPHDRDHGAPRRRHRRAAVGRAEDDPFPMESSGPPTLQTIAGGWDPLARLVDMDADGIDIAVLYPTTPGLSFLPDAERWGVVCRAYNDWLEQYCAAAPDAALRCRPRSAPGSARRGAGDGAEPGARVQGGDDPPRAVHRGQEVARSRVRPVLGGGRVGGLSHRRAPVLVPRHAERRDAARARRRHVRQSEQGPHAPAGSRQRARHHAGDGLVRGRRDLRALPDT